MNTPISRSTVAFLLIALTAPGICRSAPPKTKLSEWGKGIAVESTDQPGMTMYLWFYEWNMFEARTPGQHTRGSHDWKRTVSPDGRHAVIDAGDMKLSIQAVEDGAKLTLEITNNSDYAWSDIAGIIPCFNPGAPPDRTKVYPKAVVNPAFKNTSTWYVGKSGLEKLVKREIHFNSKLRTQIDRQAKEGEYLFTYKWPTSPDNAHAGLIMRESTDGEWVTGIAWDRFLSAQGQNPWACMHLCINVGPLEPKQSRTIKGRIYLFPGTRDECYSRYNNEFAQKK